MVLEGAVTIRAGGTEVVLKALDSVTIAPDEVREVKNLSNDMAKMLVILPYPAVQNPGGQK